MFEKKKYFYFFPEGFALANNRQVTNKCKYPKGPGWDSEAFNAKKMLATVLGCISRLHDRNASYYTKMMLRSSYMP